MEGVGDGVFDCFFYVIVGFGGAVWAFGSFLKVLSGFGMVSRGFQMDLDGPGADGTIEGRQIQAPYGK